MDPSTVQQEDIPLINQFDDEGNCNGCGILTLHRLTLTVMWTGVANLGLLAPLFRHSVLSYYVHSISMWIVAIFTFVGVFG